MLLKIHVDLAVSLAFQPFLPILSSAFLLDVSLKPAVSFCPDSLDQNGRQRVGPLPGFKRVQRDIAHRKDPEDPRRPILL